MRARHLLPLLGLLLSGCLLQNLAPERQLQDQVYQLNDETRWGRIDLASQRVHGDYRARFLLAHRAWGHDIAIADVDPTNIQIDGEGDLARSLVTVTWYDQNTLYLDRTVITQEWQRTDNGYQLHAETIIGGNEGLLADATVLDREEDRVEPTAQR